MTDTDITRKIGRKVLGIFTLIPSLFPHRVLGKLIYYTAERKARALNPTEGLKFLFDLDNSLYPLQGTLAVAYDNGLHTKHYWDILGKKCNQDIEFGTPMKLNYIE